MFGTVSCRPMDHRPHLETGLLHAPLINRSRRGSRGTRASTCISPRPPHPGSTRSRLLRIDHRRPHPLSRVLCPESSMATGYIGHSPVPTALDPPGHCRRVGNLTEAPVSVQSGQHACEVTSRPPGPVPPGRSIDRWSNGPWGPLHREHAAAERRGQHPQASVSAGSVTTPGSRRFRRFSCDGR